MRIDEQFRPPHEIITDLLAHVVINDERAQPIVEEALAYLAKIEANRQAWANLEELHKTCIFDNVGVRWESGL